MLEQPKNYRVTEGHVIEFDKVPGALIYINQITGKPSRALTLPDSPDPKADLKDVVENFRENEVYYLISVASDGTEISPEGHCVFRVDKGVISLEKPPTPPVPPKPPVPAPKPPAPTPAPAADKPKIPPAPDVPNLVQNLLDKITTLQGQVGQLATIEQINNLTKSFDGNMAALTKQLAGKADKEEVTLLNNAMKELRESIEKRVKEIEDKRASAPLPTPPSPPERPGTPETEKDPEKWKLTRDAIIKNDSSTMIAVVILGLVALVGIILGMYFYAMRSQDIGAAKSESISSQIATREAQTAMVKSFDEVNKLKDRLEGMERQRMSVPPPPPGIILMPSVSNPPPAITSPPPSITITTPPPTTFIYTSAPPRVVTVPVPPAEIHVIRPSVIVMEPHRYETLYWSPTPMGNWYGYPQQHGFRYP